MAIIRQAKVCCPKCQHKFTVRDNGFLSAAQSEKAWRALDEAMAAMDKVFVKLNKIFET